MGEQLPRVTQILEAVGLGPDLSMVGADVLAAAQKRGSAVHEAIEALSYGYFEGADESIAGYVEAYRKFVAESGYQVIAAEIEVTHAAWRYRGHPDSIGWFNAQRVLLDFKTGATDGVEYQLVGYVEAWNDEHPTELVTAAACVELRANGTYRFNEVELSAAKPIWLAAVTIFHAQKRRTA